MKIAVYGLWHLGLVTSGCVAQHNSVTGLDDDQKLISDLNKSILPIFEPGLEDLVRKNLNQTLTFSTDKNLLKEADIIWVAFDTPVDNSDNADTDFVINKIRSIFDYLTDGSVLLISSQVPVGTTDLLREEFHQKFPDKKVYFAYSPENLRLGKAIDAFTVQHRIVVGIDNDIAKEKLAKLLSPYSTNLVWMSIKSAEMVKHSLNSFLALSISFINEIATICEKVGANAAEVEKGLKSEERIGYKSYLKPGGAFAGGTLARDVKFLSKLGKANKVKTALINSIIDSNKNHQKWLQNKITENTIGKTVGVVGLSYKEGTSTLRRSQEIELCKWLNKNGFNVIAYDSDVKKLPKNLSFIELTKDLKNIFIEAGTVVIAKKLGGEDLVDKISSEKITIIDQNGILKDLKYPHNVKYISVGVSHEAK